MMLIHIAIQAKLHCREFSKLKPSLIKYQRHNFNLKPQTQLSRLRCATDLQKTVSRNQYPNILNNFFSSLSPLKCDASKQMNKSCLEN